MPLRRSRERSPPRSRSCSGSRSYSSAAESASRRFRCDAIEWPPMANETEAHDDRFASHTLATSKSRRDRMGGIRSSQYEFVGMGPGAEHRDRKGRDLRAQDPDGYDQQQ